MSLRQTFLLRVIISEESVGVVSVEISNLVIYDRNAGRITLKPYCMHPHTTNARANIESELIVGVDQEN